MKHSNDATTSIVYAYGCEVPISGLIHAEHEVWLQRALWDRLVHIDRAHERRTWETAAQDVPETAVHLAEVDRLSGEIEQLITERRAMRAKARSKIETPEIDEALNGLFAARKNAKQLLFASLKRWRKEFKEHVTGLEETRKTEVVAARQQSRCYWGNYNAVIQRYDASRKTVLKMGRRLRTTDPTRDDGCLTVQIQRTGSGLGAAWGELVGGKFNGCIIRRVPAEVGQRTYAATVDIRVDAEGHRLVLPVFLHREPPVGMRIKSVQVTWRTGAGTRRYQFTLTLSGPAERIDHPATSAVGVDLGWRLEPDGRLLVATAMDTAGELRRYHLPTDWMTAMDQVERLGSTLDGNTLALAQEVQPLLAGLPEALREPFARWRAGLGAKHVDGQALEFAVQARIRAVQGTAARADVPECIRHWYDRRQHLGKWRDGLRDKLLHRRLDLYRNWAKEIAEAHAVIGIEDMDLSEMARVKKRRDASDNALHATARAQRVRAAVFTLRQEIRHQAVKRGAQVVEVGGKTTQVCATSGHQHHTAQVDRTRRVWVCDECGETWDQDVNAAENILAAAIGASAPMLPGGEVQQIGAFCRVA